ncbi:MAG: mechanosensitive ion channel [Magnetococcales bacterium]|nr:mechanosensitive ion channel [Magnetococcales bacterium]
MMQTLGELWARHGHALRAVVIALLVGLLLIAFQIFGEHAASDEKGHFVAVGLWMVAAFVLNRLLRVYLWDGLITRKLGHKPPKLIVNMSGFLVYVLAISGISVNVYNQSLVHFWTASGVIGIVLGLSLQKILIDIFSGLAINIDPAFKLHDWILLHGRAAGQSIFGCVREINWRTTRLQTEENVMVIVPNSLIAASLVSNFALPDEKSRFTIQVCLDFSVPVERGLRVIQSGILEIAGKDGFLDNPAPKTLVQDIVDYGIKYNVNFWLLPSRMPPDRGRHLAVTAVLESLARSGIAPAAPKHEVVMVQPQPVLVDFNQPQHRQRLVEKVDLFASCLEPEEVADLAERLILRTFAAETVLFQAGDESLSMFFLAEGVAEVLLGSSAGERKKINTLKPGDAFGEISFLTGEKRSATVVFRTSAIVFELPKGAVQPILLERPDLARQLGILIARKRLEISERDRKHGLTVDTNAEIVQKGGVIESMIRTWFAFVRGPDRRKTDQALHPYPSERDRRKAKTDRRAGGSTPA